MPAQAMASRPAVFEILCLPDCLQALIHLAPLPGGGIGAADVDVPAAVAQLHQQQQDQKLDFLGPMLPPEVARGIAEGARRLRPHAGCACPTQHLNLYIQERSAGCEL
jgi:hypothetical protein